MSNGAHINSSVCVIDSSVLMEAHKRYYAFDICPGFWDSLVANRTSLKIESIDKIKKEINDGSIDDAIRKWVKEKNLDALFFSTEDDAIIQKYGEIMNWVQQHPQYKFSAKEQFATSADGWLIAYAKIKDRILVTQEVLRPDSQKRVPIPNVCEAFGVKWLDTFQMLRELETKFILPID